MWQGPEGGFKGLRVTLVQQLTGNQGPQSYNHKELNSANNLNELGKGLQASDKVATLASTW